MEFGSGRQLCADLQRGHVSANDVMDEIYSRIESVNPEVNAIVNLLPRDEAMKHAGDRKNKRAFPHYCSQAFLGIVLTGSGKNEAYLVSPR